MEMDTVHMQADANPIKGSAVQRNPLMYIGHCMYCTVQN